MENSEAYDPYSQNSILQKQDKKGIYLKDRLVIIKERFSYYAVRIFPYIGGFITFLFFYLKRIFTSFIKIAFEQLKF